MIFQEPMTSAQPGLHRSAARSAKSLRLHQRLSQAQAARRARSRCSAWSASRTPSSRVDDYPHQFSGGMRQRVDDRHGAGLQARSC
jgi:ABC-type microcin C transport system duplicated ATPase subunit YejF